MQSGLSCASNEIYGKDVLPGRAIPQYIPTFSSFRIKKNVIDSSNGKSFSIKENYDIYRKKELSRKIELALTKHILKTELKKELHAASPISRKEVAESRDGNFIIYFRLILVFILALILIAAAIGLVGFLFWLLAKLIFGHIGIFVPLVISAIVVLWFIGHKLSHLYI